MAQPLPPTPPAVLPPIRTMADDLAAAERGQFTTGELSAPGPSATSVPVPASNRVPASPDEGGRVGGNRVPYLVPDEGGRVGGKAGVQPVALPFRPPRRTGRRPVFLLVVVLVGVVAGGLALWGVRTFAPKTSGTVADVVPAEAVAFVSVRMGERGAEGLAGALLSVFEGLTPGSVQGATDLAYLLFPGPSPAEPVRAILVVGVPSLDLTAAPSLSPIPLSPKGTLVVEAAHRGRLAGLSGRVWGRETVFRKVIRGLPEDPPVLVGLRSTMVEALLQPFSPHPVLTDSPVAFALTPGDGGSPARVRGSTGRKAGEAPVSGVAFDAGIASTLPASAILAGVRPNIGSDLVELPESGKLPGALSSVLRVFRETGDAARSLGEAFVGPWAFGVLPTAEPGVRDVVAILPLKEGADPLAALRTLEGTFAGLGPYITGSAFPEATFLETEYEGVTLRYVNFGSPARSFDYAVVNSKLYLATSRESIYALVRAMNTQGDSLAARPEFAPLAGAAAGTDWLYLRSDENLRAEISPALATFHDLLRALVVKPAGAGRIEGLATISVSTSAPADRSAEPLVGDRVPYLVPDEEGQVGGNRVPYLVPDEGGRVGGNPEHAPESVDIPGTP